MTIGVREIVLDAPAEHLETLLDVIESLTGLRRDRDGSPNPLVVNPAGVDIGLQGVHEHVPAHPVPACLELAASTAQVIVEPISGQQLVVVAGPRRREEPDPGPTRVTGVRLRTRDAAGLAAFWARLLDTGVQGTTVVTRGFRIVCENDPRYTPPTWPTQERGQMLHLDLAAADLDAATALALLCGARIVHDGTGLGWGRILLDPAGHPFCLCPARVPVTVLGGSAAPGSSR